MDFGGSGGQGDHSTELASGILAGFYGKSGVSIDSLGALFVKDVMNVRIEIEDDCWINNPIGTGAGINTVTLDAQEVVNQENVSREWSWDGRRSKTSTAVYTQSATTQWGVGALVKASRFAISPRYITWNKDHLLSSVSNKSRPFEGGSVVGGTMRRRGERILASTTCHQGTLNLQYNSTVQVKFRHAHPLTYRESGVCAYTLYANGRTSWQHVID